MLDYIGHYYGLDWIATGFSLASIYMIGDHRRLGFSLGVVGALIWAGVNVFAHSIAGILLNVLLLGLFVRGYMKWKPPVAPAVSAEPTATP